HATEGFNESILGTAFWFLGDELHSPVDVRQDQADRFDNRIDVLTKCFLGLTVACARCHDHKYDAGSTRDYYALYGVLSGSGHRLARFDGWRENRAVAADLAKLRADAQPRLRRAAAEALRPALSRAGDYFLLAAQEGTTPEASPRRQGLNAELLAAWKATVK